MQCSKFDARLHALLDRRRTPERDVRLRDHARWCPRCRDLLHAQARLFAGLRSLDQPPLPEDFAHRIVAQVVASTPSSDPRLRPRAPRRASLVAAVAATLLAAALPTAWWLSRRNTHVASAHVTRPVQKSAVTRSAPRAPSENATAPQEELWWVLPSQSLLELYPPEVRQRHRQQFTEFADELAPITRSSPAAVAALRCTLPVNRHPYRSRSGALLDSHNTARLS